MYGAGSLQGAYGDAIIHCHLYPHFGEGMWGIQRTFDTLQDGSMCYPNGVQIKPLQPLPDRPLPPSQPQNDQDFQTLYLEFLVLKHLAHPLELLGEERQQKSKKINLLLMQYQGRCLSIQRRKIRQ